VCQWTGDQKVGLDLDLLPTTLRLLISTETCTILILMVIMLSRHLQSNIWDQVRLLIFCINHRGTADILRTRRTFPPQYRYLGRPLVDAVLLLHLYLTTQPSMKLTLTTLMTIRPTIDIRVITTIINHCPLATARHFNHHLYPRSGCMG
jgi:hypothetical protein